MRQNIPVIFTESDTSCYTTKPVLPYRLQNKSIIIAILHEYGNNEAPTIALKISMDDIVLTEEGA